MNEREVHQPRYPNQDDVGVRQVGYLNTRRRRDGTAVLVARDPIGRDNGELRKEGGEKKGKN